MRLTRVAILFFAGCLGTVSGIAVAAEIKEWYVPYENSRPRDPAVDSTGRVWFCGQAGAYVAYLDPNSGVFKKYDLADGANPHNLIIDEHDKIWFAANTLPYIGRLDPKTGNVTKYPMPEGTAHDPHTLISDSTGNIWFTAQWSNMIGRMKIDTGKVDLITLPEARSRPYGIKIDNKEQPWVVLFGTNKLATVDNQTLELSLIELPYKESRPRRLEITEDGSIWYGDYSRGMLGHYDPSLKEFAEWQLPGGSGSRPYGMAMDHREHIWLAEGGNPNRLVEFDVTKQAFDSVIDAPSARGSIRHMYFDKNTKSVWFGEDSNFVGRLHLP
ncbi:MAG: virginiamycin B lyase family protein [Methyloligellaceae bacterium]